MYAQALVELAKRTKLLEGNGCCDYRTGCKHCLLDSLIAITQSNLTCNEALREYIDTKLEPEEKLEFLMEVYNE